MEVRPGYKLTELGHIPGDWRLATLGQVCDFENGDRGANYPSPDSFVMIGIPFVNAGHVSDGEIDLSEMNYITRASYDRLGGGKVRAGDILFCLRGSLGKFGVVRDDFGEAAIASSLVIVRPKTKAITREYLGCYFSSAVCAKMIATWAGGAAQPNLGAQDLARFVIAIPIASGEQRAIAAALSDVDALLQGLDRLVAKKCDLKQAAMQQLLTGQTRLPGFGEEWKARRLGDVAEIVMGQSPGSSSYNLRGHGLPLIQGNGDISRRKAIVRVFTTQVTKRGRAGDILLSVRAPVGEVARAPFDVCLGRGVCAIRFPNDFLYHCLISLEPSWAKHSKGSTFDSVNSADVRAVEMLMPADRREQVAIASVLSDMDAELAVLEARRDKTRALKQGMMQELLTGRTRLV